MPGSEYATLMLAGELLAPSMDGLGSLVRMPTVCGEQNMITLAPTVYVMRYLEARGSLRSELRETALNFIQVSRASRGGGAGKERARSTRLWGGRALVGGGGGGWTCRGALRGYPSAADVL